MANLNITRGPVPRRVDFLPIVKKEKGHGAVTPPGHLVELGSYFRRRFGRGRWRLAFLRRIVGRLVAGFGLLGLHFGSGPLPIFVRPAVGAAVLFPQRIGALAHATHATVTRPDIEVRTITPDP